MDETRESPLENTPPVVICAPRGRDQRLIAALLDRHHINAASCDSLDDLFRSLQSRCGTLVIAEEALVGDAPDRLCRVLNQQPAWSELPVIVLRLKHGRFDRAMQQLLRCGGVRWLLRPVSMQSLTGLVTTSIEARLRQEQVGELLREQAELNAELKLRGDQLRDLTVELIEAEDRERHRIAELLHDDLQQMLVGASLRLEAAINQIDGRSGLIASLDQVRRLIVDSQRRCRTLSHELFPSALREGDLAAVLNWLAEHTHADSGLLVKLDCDERLGDVSPTITRFVYRTIGELLLNVVKHAKTDTAWITARRRGDQLIFSLKDRGVGFRPEQIGGTRVEAGVGLFAIRERVESLGGDLLIESTPDEGSHFRIQIPAK